ALLAAGVKTQTARRCGGSVRVGAGQAGRAQQEARHMIAEADDGGVVVILAMPAPGRGLRGGRRFRVGSAAARRRALTAFAIRSHTLATHAIAARALAS